MGKKIKLVLAILLFITGFFIFIYPRVTDMLYRHNVDNKVKEFEKVINNNIDNKKKESNNNKTSDNIYYDYEGLYKLLDARNKELYQTKQVKFTSKKSYEYDDIDLSKYGLYDGIIGFISIPTINITLPIYLGANTTNMRLGAVHLTGSSYPIGGNNTNSVIAAHRGFYKTGMFRHIDRIKIGDKLYIKNFKETLIYKATKIDIINSKNITKLTIQDNKDMITIISCHPYPFNYQRYVVYFENS